MRSLNVDDIITGEETVDQVHELKGTAIWVFKGAGFESHKWNSNVPELDTDNQLTEDSQTYAKEQLGPVYMEWGTSVWWGWFQCKKRLGRICSEVCVWMDRQCSSLLTICVLQSCSNKCKGLCEVEVRGNRANSSWLGEQRQEGPNWLSKPEMWPAVVQTKPSKETEAEAKLVSDRSAQKHMAREG